MEALEDFLVRHARPGTDVPGLLSALETKPIGSASRCSMFKAIGYTPLSYAIRFSPSSVFALLSHGEEASAEPILTTAVRAGKRELIKPLLDAGADINVKDHKGQSALHWVCYQCKRLCFEELLRWAGAKIAWDSQTPEGYNALELFDIGVSAGLASALSTTQVSEFREQLASRVDRTQMRVPADDGDALDIPGAYPTSGLAHTYNSC